MDIEKLYQEYFLTVYRYILSISRDPLTAEEITQETFFRALKNIDNFHGDSGIRVWLCQIAKNTYFDHVKRQSRHTELPDEYGEPASSAEEGFFRSEDTKEIHRILHRMREPYKEVFSLRTFGELSFADIAELFGKTESWARVTYHRARKMIGDRMRKDGFYE